MKHVVSRPFKILMSLTVLSFSFTSSLLIADTEVTKEQNKSGITVTAQFLPETSYGTWGFSSLSLHITNNGNKTITLDNQSINLHTVSPKQVASKTKMKSVFSASGEGAVIGGGLGAMGTAAVFLFSRIPYDFGIFSALVVLGICALGTLPIMGLCAAGNGLKQYYRLNKARKKIRRLQFSRKQISAHSTEDVVVFVKNVDRNRSFSLEFDTHGKNEKVLFSF